MLDIWIGETNLSVLVLTVSVAAILPAQLWLCFKVKPLWIRLAPVIILFLLAAAAAVMHSIAAGWEGLIFVFGGIYAAFMMLMCGIAWGAWAIVSFRKKQ